MHTDTAYANLIDSCLRGERVQTRNAECHRLIAPQLRFDGAPLVSARKTAWRTALREWEWFMSGSNNIRDAHESVRLWWQPWAEATGRVHGNYSQQFRTFWGFGGHVDQIQLLINGIRDHPFSRRNCATTWHAADMASANTKITNCHGSFIQAFVRDGALDLVTYQRSADVICGLPHNWIQYWAFLLWLAHRGGRRPRALIWIGGDCHVYAAHTELARRIMHAASAVRHTPELVYAPTSEEFRADDFALDGAYSPILIDRAEMIV